MVTAGPTAPRRIVLTTFGSLGDIHPYVAIAIELRRRGHAPVIATSEIYRDKIQALGLAFHALRPDMSRVRADQALMRRVMDRKQGSETVVRELVAPFVRETYEDLADACRGADAIVGHILTFAASLVAEKHGIRWVSSILQPVGFFSAIDPPVMPTAPLLRRLAFLGPWLHRAAFSAARRMTDPWFEPWHRLRAELGLPATRQNPLFDGAHAPGLVLALFSRHLAPMQADWPPQTVQTGFPFFDADGSDDLSPALARFLDGGPPPIVFTLGSSAVNDPGAFYEHGAAAARALGRRAVLLIGREARPPSSLPDGIAAFDYAPYSRLFSRACAIVHQGGVGTTGQAMRSGKPMLVMPYAHDQPDNAARICRLGVGRSIARSRFTPARAARELARLLDDPGHATRAAEIGAAVSREDGASAAAGAIERACSA